MQLLCWSIVTSVAMIAMVLALHDFQEPNTRWGLWGYLRQASLWNWLFLMAIVVLGLSRLWRMTSGQATRGFEVLDAERDGK